MSSNKFSRAHILFMIVAFACLGLTIEIFFTAFVALIDRSPLCNKPLLAMAGLSYVWMVFIYGLVPVLGILFFDRVKPLPVWVRLPLYVVIIYAIEFTSGFLLRLITGSCPWEYTSGWQVMGLIRLDYFPCWFVFAWMVERCYVFLSGMRMPDFENDNVGK